MPSMTQLSQMQSQSHSQSTSQSQEVPSVPPPTYESLDERYINQPLNREAIGPRLDAMRAEWTKVNRNMANALQKLTEAAVDLEEGRDKTGQDEEDDPNAHDRVVVLDERIKQVDAQVRDTITHRFFIQSQMEQINVLKGSFEETDTSEALLERYENGLASRINVWNAKSARSKFSTHKDYESFRVQLWEVHHEGEAMPPLASTNLFEGGRSASARNNDSEDPCSETLREETAPEREPEDDDDDDELLVGSAVESFKCPLTLLPMLNPLRSNICTHVFSREGLEDYFSHASAQPRAGAVGKPCPATACSHRQTLNDFVPDDAFARRAKAWVRRQEERNQKKKKDRDELVIDSDDEDDSDEDSSEEEIPVVKKEAR